MSSPPLQPANHTALSALPLLALDLETTGLDVRRDRVVQIGAVAMRGSQVLETPRLDLLVNPGMPIPAVATGIHGLSDADVAQAPSFSVAAVALHEALSGRIVVGHNVGFDLAVLRHEAARAGLAWSEPPALDVGLLAGALEPTLPDVGLETVAQLLGVAVEGRHRALGDALTAAQIFSRLLPRLREADVRTLGEARSFAASRTDLTLSQAQAGWLAQPGELAAELPMAPLTRIDGFLFERRVGELMSAPPIFISADAILRDAARTMAGRRVGALLVGEAGAPPQGIVTERDVLRVLAQDGTQSTSVAKAMSSPVETMHAEDMLYRALGRMQRLGIRHLCVVDGRGVPVGMISQRDLLRHRASAADMLGDALEHANDAASLAAAYSKVPETVAALVAEGLGGVEVARVVSNELRGVTARAAQITAARMLADGRGAAPAPWCLMVLGSGGRGESLLGADQDNALIHAGTPTDDAWFAAFGADIAELLDESGVPRCKGGVMAMNAEWRGTIEAWRSRIDRWLQRARPEDLLSADIFFDLMPVAGDPGLARILQADAVAAASTSPPFLGALAESVAALSPPIGLFGRIATEEGRVDLKWGGLLPLVGIARALALRIGSTERSSAERLRAAAAASRLAEGDATRLIEMQAQLLTLVLRQQLADLGGGVRPSSRVVLATLDRAELAQLKAHLRHLDETLKVMRASMAR